MRVCGQNQWGCEMKQVCGASTAAHMAGQRLAVERRKKVTETR